MNDKDKQALDRWITKEPYIIDEDCDECEHGRDGINCNVEICEFKPITKPK